MYEGLDETIKVILLVHSKLEVWIVWRKEERGRRNEEGGRGKEPGEGGGGEGE